MRSWMVLLLLGVPHAALPASNEMPPAAVTHDDIREIRNVAWKQLDDDSLPFAWTGAWLVLLGAAYVVMRRRNAPTVPDRSIRPDTLSPTDALAMLRSRYRQGLAEGTQAVLELDVLVRGELAGVSGRNARHRTTIEIRQDMTGLLGEVTQSDLELLLSLFDQIKFSGRAPDKRTIESAFDVTERFMLSLFRERQRAVS